MLFNFTVQDRKAITKDSLHCKKNHHILYNRQHIQC